MIRWLKTLRESPFTLGSYLEDLHPDLARHFVSYASELMEPQVVGMGLRLEEWSDQRLSLLLPGRWKNRNAEGRTSLGVLASATEMGLRLFWQRHLFGLGGDLHFSELRVRWLEGQRVFPGENLNLRIEASALGVDEVLVSSQAQGPSQGQALECSWTLPWFNPRQQQVAEVEVVAQVKLLAALPAASTSARDNWDKAGRPQK